MAPDAPDVLEVQGEYQTAIGNREAAADTLRHLQQVAPGSTAANSLSDLLHERSISTSDLSQVRSLAASGHNAQAVQGARSCSMAVSRRIRLRWNITRPWQAFRPNGIRPGPGLPVSWHPIHRIIMPSSHLRRR
ncbi:hypothetical protein RAA17_07240 [Komagataeibacter rhaeticus]|nr:hypothetical protein [Komagataeibacter rhaeticus]